MKSYSAQNKEPDANINCPACDRSGLEPIHGEVKYQCRYCDEIVHVTSVARANGVDELTEGADYVDWVAEALLELPEDNDEC